MYFKNKNLKKLAAAVQSAWNIAKDTYLDIENSLATKHAEKKIAGDKNLRTEYAENWATANKKDQSRFATEGGDVANNHSLPIQKKAALVRMEEMTGPFKDNFTLKFRATLGVLAGGVILFGAGRTGLSIDDPKLIEARESRISGNESVYGTGSVDYKADTNTATVTQKNGQKFNIDLNKAPK